MKDRLYTVGELKIIFDNDIKEFIKIIIYNRKSNAPYFNTILLPFYIKKKELGEIPKVIEEFVEEHKLISPLPVLESNKTKKSTTENKTIRRLQHFTKEKLEELARSNYKYVKEFSEQYKKEDIEYYNSAIFPVLEKYKHLDILDIPMVEEPETVKMETLPVIIFCPKCGSKNYIDSKYCFKCGDNINIPTFDNVNSSKPFIADHKDEIFDFNNWTSDTKNTSKKEVDYEYRNVGNSLIQNDELGGCLVSWLVIGIIATGLGIIFSLFILPNTFEKFGSGIIVYFIITGIFSLVSYILLLNKYKAGFYLHIILLIINTLISFIVPINPKELPIGLLITFVFSAIFYSLIYSNWKNFR